jgi:hypothetical protein
VTRISSVPPDEIATVPVVGENNPVVTSPVLDGFVADAEVPRLIALPLPRGVQLDPLQPSKMPPVYWMAPAVVPLQVAEVFPICAAAAIHSPLEQYKRASMLLTTDLFML